MSQHICFVAPTLTQPISGSSQVREAPISWPGADAMELRWWFGGWVQWPHGSMRQPRFRLSHGPKSSSDDHDLVLKYIEIYWNVLKQHDLGIHMDPPILGSHHARGYGTRTIWVELWCWGCGTSKYRYLSSKHVHVGNEHVGNIRQKLQFDDLPAIYINLLHICGDLPAISWFSKP